MLPLLKVDFNPVAEFTDFVHHPYVSLPFGLDINKAVIYMWMAAALTTILTLVVVRRGLKLRPDGGQTAAEAVYDPAGSRSRGAGCRRRACGSGSRTRPACSCSSG
jgi:hypothetical protein